MIKYILFFSLLFGTAIANAAPVLFFSDLTNGPATGVGDGQGSGTIVTIWGYGLGSSQGESSITVCGTTPAYIYYWQNATGQKPGGPADLYTYNKLQEIAFSIPASCDPGATTISVTVGGETSNTLPFTVRSGDIFHVMTTGNDSTGDGSYGSPWQTLDGFPRVSFTAGDIVYAHDGVTDTSTDGTAVYFSGKTSTIDNQFGVVAYPNSTVIAEADVTDPNDNADGISFFQSSAFVISKITVKVGNYDDPITPDVLQYKHAVGIKPTANGRIIGCEITDSAGRCTSGAQGAISTNCAVYDYASNAKLYGNYIHDWGCDQTSKFQHTFYLSIRNDGDFNVAPWEYAYNCLVDNKSKYGIHAYDEAFGTPCGDITDTLKIHHNFVVNQKGPGINVGTGGTPTSNTCWTNDFLVYDNVLINVGLGPDDESNAEESAIRISDAGTTGTVRVYNNTIYGWGDDEVNSTDKAAFLIYNSGLNVTAIYTNNIVFDTEGFDYFSVGSYTVSGADNIFYSSGGGTGSIPGTVIDSIASDPLLTNTGTLDLTLTGSSPAINAGTDLSIYFTTDINGLDRDATFDIGAYEYGVDTTPPEISSAAVNGTAVSIIFTESVTNNAYTTGDADIDCTTDTDYPLTYVSGSGTVNWSFTSGTAAANGETCNLDWTTAANDVEDDAGNDLATLSNQAMINNTPAEPAATVIPARAMVIGSGSQAANISSGNAAVYLGSY